MRIMEYAANTLMGICLLCLCLVTMRFLWPSLVVVPGKFLARIEVGRALYDRDPKKSDERFLVGLVERLLRGISDDPLGRMHELRQALTWIGKSAGGPASNGGVLKHALLGRLYPRVIYEMVGLLEQVLTEVPPSFNQKSKSVMADRILVVLAVMTRKEELITDLRGRTDLDDKQKEESVRKLEEAATALDRLGIGTLGSVGASVRVFHGSPPTVEQVGELLAVALALGCARKASPPTN